MVSITRLMGKEKKLKGRIVKTTAPPAPQAIKNYRHNTYVHEVLGSKDKHTSYVSRNDYMKELIKEKNVSVAVDVPKSLEDEMRKKHQRSLKYPQISSARREEIATYKEKKKTFFEKYNLTVEEGCVKKYKGSAVMTTIDEGHKKHTDPIFHSIPLLSPSRISSRLAQEMRAVEQRIVSHLRHRRRRRHRQVTMPDGRVIVIIDGGGHNNGGNNGINFGFRVLTGGGHANKERNISGSIQACDDCPVPTEELWNVIRSILDEAFGKKLWYKRAIRIAEQLQRESGDIRFVPGTPISGIWMSTQAKEKACHIDQNCVGPSFVFSLYKSPDGNPVYLNVMSDDRKYIYKVKLEDGAIVGGRWSNNSHCNTGVSDANAERISWTLYMDYRIFSPRYRVLKGGVIKELPGKSSPAMWPFTLDSNNKT